MKSISVPLTVLASAIVPSWQLKQSLELSRSSISPVVDIMVGLEYVGNLVELMGWFQSSGPGVVLCGVWQKTHGSFSPAERIGVVELTRKSCLEFKTLLAGANDPCERAEVQPMSASAIAISATIDARLTCAPRNAGRASERSR